MTNMGAAEFFSGAGNEGSEEQKSPSGVQGQNPGGDDIFSK